LRPIISAFIVGLSFSLIGCSTQSNQRGATALFDTKTEAEAAAKNFNCTGAHKMGEKWMPCKSHKAHEEHNNDGHKHHHNH
tara:strand:- start:1021 stop:1263 length:243 start_codon:yes stop_codon:yes gene_type:complete